MGDDVLDVAIKGLIHFGSFIAMHCFHSHVSLCQAKCTQCLNIIQFLYIKYIIHIIPNKAHKSTNI